MERGTFMDILKIKNVLYTLIKYEDSSIVHTVPEVIELSYCNSSKTFQVTTLVDQRTLSYDDYDIEKVAQALYKILNSIEQKTT